MAPSRRARQTTATSNPLPQEETDHYTATTTLQSGIKHDWLEVDVQRISEEVQEWSELKVVGWVHSEDRKYELRRGDRVAVLYRCEKRRRNRTVYGEIECKISDIRRDIDSGVVYMVGEEFEDGKLNGKMMVFEHTSISDKLNS